MKQSIAETFHGGSSNEFIVSRRGASNSSKSTIPLMHSEEAMTAYGTLLPAKAVSCPQMAEGDIGALADRSGFDVVDGARSQQRGAIG
jgi:hypothetical protein